MVNHISICDNQVQKEYETTNRLGWNGDSQWILQVIRMQLDKQMMYAKNRNHS